MTEMEELVELGTDGITGKRLFDGETISHTLADVLRAPIDLGELPAGLPPSIRRLVGRQQGAGRYTVTWQGVNDAGQPVASGVYFYKLNANTYSNTRKMILLK